MLPRIHTMLNKPLLCCEAGTQIPSSISSLLTCGVGTLRHERQVEADGCLFRAKDMAHRSLNAPFNICINLDDMIKLEAVLLTILLLSFNYKKRGWDVSTLHALVFYSGKQLQTCLDPLAWYMYLPYLPYLQSPSKQTGNISCRIHENSDSPTPSVPGTCRDLTEDDSWDHRLQTPGERCTSTYALKRLSATFQLLFIAFLY